LVAFGITRAIFTSNPKSQSDPMFEVSTAARLHIHELKRVDMDELARESDVLVVLAPGGSNTYHIINEGFLRKMKNTAILVNTSRGSLVDSDALAKALQEKWIWGAGLDVVEGKCPSGFSHNFSRLTSLQVSQRLALITLS
jgi:glyoxylate/hydroxypyruvate reductase